MTVHVAEEWYARLRAQLRAADRLALTAEMALSSWTPADLKNNPTMASLAKALDTYRQWEED